mmetsp:Transcript_47832/g.127966  ORF Transcript_47832/g.127966 Transcript_47832/m.127966 type:complete len:259 (+) Transcript_47832:713-1489(+)
MAHILHGFVVLLNGDLRDPLVLPQLLLCGLGALENRRPVLLHGCKHNCRVVPEPLVHEFHELGFLRDRGHGDALVGPDLLAADLRHLLEHLMVLHNRRKDNLHILPDVVLRAQHDLPIPRDSLEHDLVVREEIRRLRLLLLLAVLLLGRRGRPGFLVQLRVQRDRQVQGPPVLFAGRRHDVAVPREFLVHELQGTPVVAHHVQVEVVAHLPILRQSPDKLHVLAQLLGGILEQRLVVPDEVDHAASVRAQLERGHAQR